MVPPAARLSSIYQGITESHCSLTPGSQRAHTPCSPPADDGSRAEASMGPESMAQGHLGRHVWVQRALLEGGQRQAL